MGLTLDVLPDYEIVMAVCAVLLVTVVSCEDISNLLSRLRLVDTLRGMPLQLRISRLSEVTCTSYDHVVKIRLTGLGEIGLCKHSTVGSRSEDYVPNQSK